MLVIFFYESKSWSSCTLFFRYTAIQHQSIPAKNGFLVCRLKVADVNPQLTSNHASRGLSFLIFTTGYSWAPLLSALQTKDRILRTKESDGSYPPISMKFIIEHVYGDQSVTLLEASTTTFLGTLNPINSFLLPGLNQISICHIENPRKWFTLSLVFDFPVFHRFTGQTDRLSVAIGAVKTYHFSWRRECFLVSFLSLILYVASLLLRIFRCALFLCSTKRCLFLYLFYSMCFRFVEFKWTTGGEFLRSWLTSSSLITTLCNGFWLDVGIPYISRCCCICIYPCT